MGVTIEDLYDGLTSLKEATVLGFASMEKRFEKRFEGIDVRLDRVETRLGRVETRLESVEDGLNAVRTDIADLKSRSL